MTDSESAADAWRTLFPVELPGVTIGSWDPPLADERFGLVARLSLYDPETYRGTSQDVQLVGPGELERLPEVIASVRARLDALRQHPVEAETLMSSSTRASFGLEEIVPDEETFTAIEADVVRREAALTNAMERFAGARQKVRTLYGLRLPAHLAVFAALFESLTPLERSGMQSMGRWPAGIMLFFEADGLERQTREGLDGRLEMRFRRDPPELVTVMSGDSDGLHYGLWYDDPAELPSCIAANWARDSAETEERGPTVLQVLRNELEARFDEGDEDEPVPLGVFALAAAVEWFAEADRSAWEVEGIPRWAGATRGPILGGICPALPHEAGNPQPGWDALQLRQSLYRDPAQEGYGALIANARQELASGAPALALTVGHELHWMDDDATRDEALELLTEAYRALGRDALASIAEVHHRHRDLPSVGVYDDPP